MNGFRSGSGHDLNNGFEMKALMTTDEGKSLSKGVIVLGVHRSGTSLLAAAMRAMGCALGEFPLKAGEENPKGYFEHPDIRAFNDKLLASLGASWDNWGFFAGSVDFGSAAFAEARSQANALLHKCFGGVGVWAVKDPRMTHLLPFWEATFAEFGIDVRRVLIIRDPAEVIESQLQRYRRNPKFHYALSEESAIAAWWAVIMLGVVKTLNDDNTFLISHADLYDNTVNTMQACADFLQMPVKVEALQAFSEEFVDRGLRRSRPVSLQNASIWGAAAKQIFSAMQAQPTPRCFTGQQAQAIWQQQSQLRTVLPYLAPVVSSHHIFKSALEQSAPVAGREQTVTVYVSEVMDGAPQPFSVKRRAVCGYPLDGKRLALALALPNDLGPLAALRVDISDQMAVVELHSLVVTTSQNEELWRWDGCSAAFTRLVRVACVAGKGGLAFVAHQNDPQMVLNLPAQVLGNIKGGAVVHFEMTPYPMHERLTAVLADLQAAPHPAAGTSWPKAAPVPRLAADLADVAGLLRQSLAARDEQIARQQQQLAQQEAEHAQLRHDLIRAQAQLDLLKDVVKTRPSTPARPPLRPRRAPK